MKTLFIEGIRCFREAQEIPIRPVTLLVGENSTGKSTVLAMVRAAWDLAHVGMEPDFNESPFDLGAYDAIAHYHGGQGKRVGEFSLGSTWLGDRESKRMLRNPRPGDCNVQGTFREEAGQPALAQWRLERGDLAIEIHLNDAKIARVSVRKNKTKWAVDVPRPRGPQSLLQTIFRADHRSPGQSTSFTSELIELLHDGRLRPVASAPIRSKPERTYDPKRGLPEPEGSHVPMELATLRAVSEPEFHELAKRIEEYASRSALFSKLAVKRLGRKTGDPFQLLISVDKFPFNVRDVGYGVSQILPVLVDILTASQGTTFLLQQPEVHLHPRAQAELGTLLVQQAVSNKQTFVVETHSDYLLDRVRMELRDGKARLKPDDVAILYFERKAGQARIHPIQLDERGNFINRPKGYRSFFLDEERRLLGL